MTSVLSSFMYYIEMALLKGLFRRTTSLKSVGTGDFHFECVGESFYFEALARLASDIVPSGDGTREFDAILVPEPHNAHDPNAVAVHAKLVGCIAHFPREDAAIHSSAIRRMVKERQVPVCRGRLYGGTDDKPYYGVWLDFDDGGHQAARSMGHNKAHSVTVRLLK